MPPMSQSENLSDVEQTLLLAMWKLRGIGKNAVEEKRLLEEITNESQQNLEAAVDTLVSKGFLDQNHGSDLGLLSLTPLGLAILRKLEEDRLQELK